MWNDFFLFTRSEKRGVLVLLCIVILVLIFRLILTNSLNRQFIHDELSDFERKINCVNDSLLLALSIEKSNIFFAFNPNAVTAEQLRQFGFSKYQVKAFLGYREKLGSFKCIEEISKVYGIDDDLLLKISENLIWDNNADKVSDKEKGVIKDSLIWINLNQCTNAFWLDIVSSNVIRDSVLNLVNTYHIKKNLPLGVIKRFSETQLLNWLYVNRGDLLEENVELIDVNLADATQLKQLNGVGSKLATRIVKYRELLGGFCDVNQLNEVYGISDDLYEDLQSFLKVNRSGIRKLDTNSFLSLKRHPYINARQAKELYNLYRNNKFPSKAELLLLSSITNKDFERLINYLNVRK
jgi:competence ComEA-like helix-hairpin-helix protein